MYSTVISIIYAYRYDNIWQNKSIMLIVIQQICLFSKPKGIMASNCRHTADKDIEWNRQ